MTTTRRGKVRTGKKAVANKKRKAARPSRRKALSNNPRLKLSLQWKRILKNDPHFFNLDPKRVPYSLEDIRHQRIYYDARLKQFKMRPVAECRRIHSYLFYYRYHCIAYVHRLRQWVVRDAANNPRRQFHQAKTWQACRNWIKNELAKKAIELNWQKKGQ